MAGEKNLLNKLINQARSLDEEALAAFSNKGLVRRASKDFAADKTIAALLSADEKTIKIQAADGIVALTEKGLTESVCDCPATETCRHILIACFWLAEQTAQAEPSAVADGVSDIDEPPVDKIDDSSFQHLLNISLADLEKAAGKRLFAQAIEFLQKNADSRVNAPKNGVCLVEFPDANISVRLLQDAGAGGHLCSCRKTDVCQHKIAAILALRRENAVEFLPAATEKAESVLKLSEAQIKVLQKTQKLFEEFVEIGCPHLSASSVERLQTLATSAGGASLFRLSFALKSLADGLNLSLRRSAQADETAWLIFLSKTYALVSALLAADAPNPKFIGTSRSAYEEIGTLELAGVGAYQWQTLSGYHGVTILFWENRAKRFFSWTDARPKTDASFAPSAAFAGEMRWQNVNSPKQAAESVLKLQNAARNSQNRLSGSGQINGFVTGATDVEKLDFGTAAFSDWQQLRRYFAALFPCGLREREIFKEFAVVRPAQFGERVFDSTKQIFTWQVLDENKDSLEIRLNYNSYNESAIEALEKLNPAKDEVKGILVRLALDSAGLYLQPLSLFLKPKSSFFAAFFNKNKDEATQIIHLNLTAKSDKKATVQAQNDKSSADETEVDETSFLEEIDVAGRTPRQILALRELLQNMAESGTKSISVNTLDEIGAIAESLDSAGLSELSQAAGVFTKTPANELSKNLLKLIFLVGLSLEITQIKRLTV